MSDPRPQWMRAAEAVAVAVILPEDGHLTAQQREENLRCSYQEAFILDVTEKICGVMNDADVSRQELARRLGRTKGYVSQLLNGDRNMTLRTLADIVIALNIPGAFTVGESDTQMFTANFNQTPHADWMYTYQSVPPSWFGADESQPPRRGGDFPHPMAA